MVSDHSWCRKVWYSRLIECVIVHSATVHCSATSGETPGARQGSWSICRSSTGAAPSSNIPMKQFQTPTGAAPYYAFGLKNLRKCIMENFVL